MKKIILNTLHKKSKHYKKYFTLVDDDDFEKLNKFRWCVAFRNNNKYACTYTKNGNTFMHNMVMGCKRIDHEDMNGLNNQKSNLRVATMSQNAMNSRGCIGVSKYRGVSKAKRKGKWIARIHKDGKKYSLGVHDTRKQAAIIYNAKALELFGEFAYQNNV